MIGRVGFGLGTMDPSSDGDYWWFEALAGDKVAVPLDNVIVGDPVLRSAGLTPTE